MTKLQVYEDRRIRKNGRSRERAMERKMQYEAISSKPEREWTLEERRFMADTTVAKYKKNEGDRMRRKKIKREERGSASTSASVCTSVSSSVNEESTKGVEATGGVGNKSKAQVRSTSKAGTTYEMGAGGHYAPPPSIHTHSRYPHGHANGHHPKPRGADYYSHYPPHSGHPHPPPQHPVARHDYAQSHGYAHSQDHTSHAQDYNSQEQRDRHHSATMHEKSEAYSSYKARSQDQHEREDTKEETQTQQEPPQTPHPKHIDHEHSHIQDDLQPLTPIPQGSRAFDAIGVVEEMFDMTPTVQHDNDHDRGGNTPHSNHYHQSPMSHFVFPSPPRNESRQIYSPTLQLSVGASILDASLDEIAYSPTQRAYNTTPRNTTHHADFPHLTSPLNLSSLDLPRRSRPADESQSIYDAFASDFRNNTNAGTGGDDGIHNNSEGVGVRDRGEDAYSNMNRQHQEAIAVSFSVDTM